MFDTVTPWLTRKPHRDFLTGFSFWRLRLNSLSAVFLPESHRAIQYSLDPLPKTILAE